ncbi:MAG: outer membrane beta-barrel protein [Nevskia sp.]|nr:outer membrane beta-barrel protein [Nevskia sp.]
MKRVLVIGTAAGALCVSGGCFASPLWFQPQGNLALYGSYMQQNDNQAGLNPDGGGGGVQAGLSLTPNFFIGGSYQYDYLSESNAPAASFGLGPGQISYGEKINQDRLGGGLVFRLPAAPIDVFGKVEYVHFDYQTVHATVNGAPYGNSDRANDDGVGFHAGLQTRTPGFSIYGSVGYLNLSNSEGPEINVGFEVPMAPFTWGFVEYRYDNLHYSGYSDHNQTDDVRAGVRLSF